MITYSLDTVEGALDPLGGQVSWDLRRGYVCVWAGWGGGGAERRDIRDDNGPFWTDGQHGHQIEYLNIIHYHCAGWNNARTHQKKQCQLVRGRTQKLVRGSCSKKSALRCFGGPVGLARPNKR